MKKGGAHEIKLPVRATDAGGNSNLKIANIKYDPDAIASTDEKFCKGMVYLMETQGANYDAISIWAFREACERNNVTCQELYDAYWKAYADPFVGKEGIQFRHLWKHIEQSRTGGSRIMTYNQMLNDMHKNNYSMSMYKQINELDENGNRKWILK